MELHQLRYFVAVAETGNFTRAAARCFVSQPSLSQQIMKLEGELNQKLFDRLGRRAELTPAGRAFYERAQRILLEVEDAARVVRDEGDTGKIRIGILPSIAPYVLPRLLPLVREQLPKATIEVFEDFRTALVDEIVAGRLDVAIASLPPERSDLEVEILRSEPLLVALPQEHPLAERPALKMHDLNGERLVLLGEASSLGLQTRRFFGDNQITAQVACRCAQVRTVKTLVAAGLGVAILPEMASGTETAGLVFRSLLDATPERQIVLMRNALRFHSRVEEQFVAIVRQFFGVRKTASAQTADASPTAGR